MEDETEMEEKGRKRIGADEGWKRNGRLSKGGRWKRKAGRGLERMNDGGEMEDLAKEGDGRERQEDDWSG
jgi:hypothetical protein